MVRIRLTYNADWKDGEIVREADFNSSRDALAYLTGYLSVFPLIVTSLEVEDV